jgi:hypothetical protein
MDTYIIHPETKEQESALKAFVRSLKMKFETTKESPYKPEFVEKIRKSEQQLKDGKSVRIQTKEEINKLLGL